MRKGTRHSPSPHWDRTFPGFACLNVGVSVACFESRRGAASKFPVVMRLAVEELANWIWYQNLKAFLETLALLAEYELSVDELDAIQLGVADSDTDAIPERWYEYEFVGKYRVEFRIGQDQGTDVVILRLLVPPNLVDKVEVMLAIMNQYTLTHGN